MGYEYHDRKRDYRGRFDKVHRSSQVHIYCNFEEWRVLRMAANLAQVDMSSFCRQAALNRAGVVLDGAGIDPKKFDMKFDMMTRKRSNDCINGESTTTQG